jgi:hypothetical protein
MSEKSEDNDYGMTPRPNASPLVINGTIRKGGSDAKEEHVKGQLPTGTIRTTEELRGRHKHIDRATGIRAAVSLQTHSNPDSQIFSMGTREIAGDSAHGNVSARFKRLFRWFWRFGDWNRRLDGRVAALLAMTG